MTDKGRFNNLPIDTITSKSFITLHSNESKPYSKPLVENICKYISVSNYIEGHLDVSNAHIDTKQQINLT